MNINSTTIEFAENLLQCEYFDYINDKYPSTIIPRVHHDQDYIVPDHIAPHLDFISPTTRFPSTLTIHTHDSTSNPSDATAITPNIVREIYLVGNTTGKALNNTQAVASFLEQYYNKVDLGTFWKRYDIPNTQGISIFIVPLSIYIAIIIQSQMSQQINQVVMESRHNHIQQISHRHHKKH